MGSGEKPDEGTLALNYDKPQARQSHLIKIKEEISATGWSLHGSVC